MKAGLPSANVTSGRYLIELLRRNAESDPAAAKKYNLGFDVYIKHRSYVILNKTFFILALISGAFVTLWPVIAVILAKIPPVWEGIELIGAAVVQTMITGAAAFSIYIYQYYKRRQISTENLLRLIVFTDVSIDRLAHTVMDEMSRIDQGFGFHVKMAQDEKE
jgi:hypothetical protein